MSSPYLTLLEALRSSCGLPEFPDPLPSTQMDLELENGPTITIDFDEETQYVSIFSSIGTYQPDHELELLKKVAQANFLWMATAGSTLSVRPEIQTLYLACQMPVLSLDGTVFVTRVEKFVETVKRWQKILEDPAHEPILESEGENSGSLENISGTSLAGQPSNFIKA